MSSHLRIAHFLALLSFLVVLCRAGFAVQAQSALPDFNQIVVFGDSLSDTGNVGERTNALSGGQIHYPGELYNYSEGRFTNSNDTSPSSLDYLGVWHEQLAQSFLRIPLATCSLTGGTNYAFGGATTIDGSRYVPIVHTNVGYLIIEIDDMGKQVDRYLSAHPPQPNILYILWGGTNDILSTPNVAAARSTAGRVAGLAARLATAGAQNIMVLNLPPLGTIPSSSAPEIIQAWNTASAEFRKQLDYDLTATLNFLVPQGINPTVYRVDIWKSMIRLLCHPENDGFTDTSDESQGDSEANPDHFLFWDGVHPTTAGHYWVAKQGYHALTTPTEPTAKAINISTRVFVDAGEKASIAGFIITGGVQKRVLIRGIGPSLATSGVPNPLGDPTLTLFGELGNVLAENDNWRETQEAEIAATGIAPQNDFESAIVADLWPGHYTAVLTGKNDTAGNGLIEVYDLNRDSNSTLTNLSTRGFVGSGNDAMIGGVVVADGDSPLMVFRAIGPSLARAGILHPLSDPTLELHDGNGAMIAFNDDWRNGPLQAVQATELAPIDDHESAIVTFLSPGNYTAVVGESSGGTGVALIEAYRVP